MKTPADIIGKDNVEALHAAGWIVVRHDAIRLAQAHAMDEMRETMMRMAGGKQPEVEAA